MKILKFNIGFSTCLRKSTSDINVDFYDLDLVKIGFNYANAKSHNKKAIIVTIRPFIIGIDVEVAWSNKLPIKDES